MRAMWAAIAALVTGCYDPPHPVCGFRCGPAGACPDRYTCAVDGYCQLDGVFAVCGSLDAGSVDAPPNVFQTPCPPTPDATVITADFMFLPADVTIPVGGIVHFMLEPEHHIVPDPSFGDHGLRLGFGADACMQFVRPGSYPYYCDQHAAFGSLTVE